MGAFKEESGGQRWPLFPLVSTNPVIRNGISIAYAKSVHCQRHLGVYRPDYRWLFKASTRCASCSQDVCLEVEGG